MVAVVAVPQSPSVPDRQDTAERWQRARERAKAANVQLAYYAASDTWFVTSASHPGVVYESDGHGCTCLAYANGDPVCLHRAAVRDHLAARAALGIELLAAKAALATIDDELAAYNASVDGDGAFAYRNRRRHDELLAVRDIAQRRVWDAQDALGRTQDGQAAA